MASVVEKDYIKTIKYKFLFTWLKAAAMVPQRQKVKVCEI